ncbi:MAG: LysM peptidoglycan-binding domain-containing protein [Rhodoglobus sp.]
MSTVSGTFGTSFGTEFSGTAFTAERPRSVAPRLRLTKRGRGVLMTVAATPLVIAAFLFALNGTPATASLEGSSAGFTYLTVESGQSLWQLAEDLAPTADPRDTIAEIMTLNQLESADVFAGQEIALPAHLVD